MKTLTLQEVTDLLYGCAVLGTGGGGGLAEGLEMVEADYAAGRTVKLIDVNDIPDDAYIGTPYGCGAPVAADAQEDLPEEYRRLPRLETSPTIKAFQGLEEFLGEKFVAVSSTELGGLNTAEALHIASLLDIPIADADPAGRSVPELQHSTYFVNDVPIGPMGIASEFGDVAILSEVYDDLRAETLVRSLAVACNNLVGVTDHPTTGKIYRESVIVGALSYAMKIGELLRVTKEQGGNIAEVIANENEGAVVFTGTVTAVPWETRDGFNYGDIHINGTGTFANETYQIWYKNENLMAYRNGEVDVTCPDLICVFDGEGNPLTNPDAKVGMEVTVIVLPAPEVWKTEKGLACFGPKSFGYDVEYVPFKACKAQAV